MLRPQNIDWLLLTRYVCNEATEAEKREVHAWLIKDEVNAQLLEQIKTAYTSIDFQTEEFSYSNGLSYLSDKLQEGERAGPGQQPKPRYRRSKKKYFIVACLSVLLTISLLLLNKVKRPEIQRETAQIEKSTLGGQKSTIVLSDGSTVLLNSNSKLIYPAKFSSENRVVYLEGEAFFEIVKDSKRPFIVKCEKLTTKVLGTSFNINAFPGKTLQTVTVASGKVSVQGNNLNQKASILLPAQQANLHTEHDELAVSKADMATALGWKEGKIIFKESGMEEVVEVLEAWYGIHIVFEGDSVPSCTLTAEFHQETLVNVLEAIAHISSIEYSISEKGIIITGACN